MCLVAAMWEFPRLHVLELAFRNSNALCRFSWSRTLRPQDTSASRHFGTTKLVPKFKPNHRWSCVSSELSWVEVSRLFLDHGTRVEVSRTMFLVSKCLGIGAEVSQSVLMPKCPVTVSALLSVIMSGSVPLRATFRRYAIDVLIVL